MKEEQLTFDELQLFSRRDLIIRSAIGVPFVGIVWRLWNLQIKQGKTFKNLAKGNRIRRKSEPALRGIIYDRKGVALAKNIPSYSLMLVREDTPDVAAVLKKVSATLKIPLNKMEKALKSQKRVAKFNPIQLHENLTLRQIALIGAYHEEFPGVSIDDKSPRRYYPLQKTGAHVFGYMNQITKAQLKKLPAKKIQSAKKIGQEGIEAVYNEQLIGTDGGRQFEVDNTGREIRTLPNPIDPKPGNDVLLNIDSRLQKEIEKIMGDRKGSVVVMNPHNGEVLAMVSLPAFDPNEFSQGLSFRRWRELKNDPFHVMNNSCIQGAYFPGSTFKMVVAAAALEMGIIDEHTEILCEGYFKINRSRWPCWKRSGHGSLNVVQALEHSCNIFFFEISMKIGIDNIKKYAKRLGLGELTGIDLLNENKALIPDRAWMKQRFNREWKIGDTPNVSIGQGSVTVTPLQLVNYVNVIANGGYLPRPRVVKNIILNNPDVESDEVDNIPKIRTIENVRRKVDIKPETLEILRRGMTLNVAGEDGTGKWARSNLVTMAGKTGTAQIVSLKTQQRLKKEKGEIDERLLDHAWFVAYAPIEKPKISAVVMIENGRAGRNAARLMKKIMDFYFTEIDSVPIPVPASDGGFKAEDGRKDRNGV
ncbi:MAG: penicillin-binding protein 2 [Proteobacteria bacterium]|nr:penicillin-binding protein 2 [Pseudomonadota bacterium]